MGNSHRCRDVLEAKVLNAQEKVWTTPTFYSDHAIDNYTVGQEFLSCSNGQKCRYIFQPTLPINTKSHHIVKDRQ